MDHLHESLFVSHVSHVSQHSFSHVFAQVLFPQLEFFQGKMLLWLMFLLYPYPGAANPTVARRNMTLPGENGQNLVEWRFRKEQTRGKVIVFGRKLRVSTLELKVFITSEQLKYERLAWTQTWLGNKITKIQSLTGKFWKKSPIMLTYTAIFPLSLMTRIETIGVNEINKCISCKRF